MSERATALVKRQEEATAQSVQCAEPIPEWLPTETLSTLTGTSLRAAQKAALSCLSGGTWRGVRLEVRYEGRALMIHGASLPPDLRDIWRKRYETGLPVTAVVPTPAPAKDDRAIRAKKDQIEREWKLALLAPALLHRKFSRARSKALQAIAGKEHIKPNGKPYRPKLSTLHEWLNNLQEHGEHALARKPRKKEEKPRVLISRAWSDACPLPEEKKAEIAGQFAEHVRKLWEDGAAGWKRINQLASVDLMERCRAAGWEGATVKNCTPGRAYVERFREHGVVAVQRRNAKLFFDKFTPRIHRNRQGYQPADIVIGDVHPFDVQREVNGRIVHARLISWLDVATYDLFVSVVILPPGRGIRQEDVAASFVDMVLAWGLPRQLRLDNGAEYKWDAMIGGFYALGGLIDDFYSFRASILGQGEAGEMIDGEQFQPRNRVSRARPYNAPAKQIEAVFGIVEQSFFSLMPGWVGGDRLNKRTHKVGEAPRAHDGTNEEFLKDIETCIALYRNTPQKDGSSPNDKRRAAIEAGWRPVAPDRQTLLYALSETRKLRVLPGGIQVDGLWYQGDALIPLIGKRVEVNVAKWDRAQIFYFDDVAKRRHVIPRATYYEQDDPAGAKEQARMAAVQSLHLRQLRGKKKPLDLMKEAERYNAAMPPPPEIPEGITITTPEGAEIAKALKDAKKPAPVRLQLGESIHPNTGALLSIAPPKKEGPGAALATPGPASFLPPPLPKKLPNPAPTEFDLLRNLLPSCPAQPKE